MNIQSTSTLSQTQGITGKKCAYNADHMYKKADRVKLVREKYEK